jgi:hypothetical protein
MARKLAIMAISSVGVLTIWMKARHSRHPRLARLEPRSFGDADDDAMAEFIKRARPALERARSLY